MTGPNHQRTAAAWPDTRLKNLFTSVRNGVWGDDPDEETDTFCARGTDFDRATARVSAARMPRRLIAPGALREHQLRPGDLVLEKSGGSSDQPVGSVALFDLPVKAVCSNFNARLRVSPGVDPRFACYLMNSRYWSGLTRQFVKQTTGIQNLDADQLMAQHCPLPPPAEQRRIADFLDAETARIDHVVRLRHEQAELLRSRARQVTDGVIAGDRAALREIGYRDSPDSWANGKVARLFTLIPGYAFASAGFVRPGNGVRLLRGINVAPGRIDWSAETVAWDVAARPVDGRFSLRLDDLVVGMDRPWISSGTRIALVQEADLPSLLLQRVACLRARGTSSTRYLRFVLGSSHFRLSLEGEATGVSVPHISGDQIGAFGYRLPPPADQVLLAKLLDGEQARGDAQAALIDRQLALLTERRQALITAAVTGAITV